MFKANKSTVNNKHQNFLKHCLNVQMSWTVLLPGTVHFDTRKMIEHFNWELYGTFVYFRKIKLFYFRKIKLSKIY